MAASDASPGPRLGVLEHGGQDEPDVVLATELPHDGPLGFVAGQVREAVRLVLEQRGWRAGRHAVGYRSCDDADGRGGVFNDLIAEANVTALIEDPAVVAVIGPFNSGAAMCALPIAAAAGLALVSPSCTYVGLNSPGPVFYRDEPARYTPDGTRAFVRVFPNDYAQAAAITQLLESRGRTAPYVLHDGLPYGRAIAEALVRTTPVAGLTLAGLENWPRDRDGAEAAVRRVTVSGADALVVAGVPDGGTGALLAAMFEAAEAVPAVAADAFTTVAADPAADGLLVVTPGVRPGAYPPAGERLIDALAARLGVERGEVEPYAVHAAEAADLVLEAIADGDGTREEVLAALFAAQRDAGPLGAYHLAENGDALPNGSGVVCGFTVHRIEGGEVALDSTILPRPELVAAASS